MLSDYYRLDRHGNRQLYSNELLQISKHEKQIPRIFGITGEPKRGEAILDIGSGCGHLIAALSRALPHCDLIGIEPNVALVMNVQQQASARKVRAEIQATTLEDFKLTLNRKVKVAFFMTVFEHLLDPLSALQKVKSLLSEDGHIVIVVPDVMEPSSLGLDYFFRKQHIFYFSEHTISNLLRKSGFTISGVMKGSPFSTHSCPSLCVVASLNVSTDDFEVKGAEAERIKDVVALASMATRITGPIRFVYRKRFPKVVTRKANSLTRNTKKLLRKAMGEFYSFRTR